MGFANVVDSLYAVKKTVFEEKRFTMAELAEWLSQDWQDAEDKRTYLLRRIPKYGNDNDEVDAMAARVVEHYCDVLAEYRNFRGGFFWPGIFSVGFHITMGAFTAATPDGRFAGDVLGQRHNPDDRQRRIRAHRDHEFGDKAPRGKAAQRRQPEHALPGEKDQHGEPGGPHHGPTSRRAGRRSSSTWSTPRFCATPSVHPEKHRDLFVRVSGYSAEFTGLERDSPG